MTMATAFEHFLSALGPEEDDAYVQRIETAFGVTCSDDARRLLARTTQDGEADHFFTIHQPAYDGANVFAGLLRQPVHLLAALVGAVPLGTDGGGRTYLLRVGDTEEVGLYDPGLGQVTFLATSVEAFGALNHAYAVFDELATAHDVDVDDIIDGKPFEVKDPKAKELTKLLEALKPHLLLNDEIDIISDFTEVLCALGGPFEAAPSSSMEDDAENTWWLRQVFDQRGLRPADIGAAVPASDSNDVAGGLYGLWRSFFLRDSAALAESKETCRAHDAALLKDAAAFVDDLEAGKLLHFGYLKAATDLAHGSLMGEAVTAPPTKDHPILAEDYDDEAIQKLIVELRGDPSIANRWDQLAYHFFGLERWSDMLEVAKASLAIEPHSYYAWQQLGIALTQLENHDAALRAYDAGLALNPHPNLWFNKAGSLLELGLHDDVITHLEFSPSEGRREALIAMDDFDSLEGRPRYDALIKA